MSSFQQLFLMGMDRHVPALLPIVPDGVVLNLGAGNKHLTGARSLDLPEWDADAQYIPAATESVDAVAAFHFLEHVRDPIAVLMDIQRVLKIGGHATIVVPHRLGSMAYQDLDHKHFFTEDTWKILMRNPYYDRHSTRGWQLEVRFNVIAGINERNLALFTQMVKTP